MIFKDQESSSGYVNQEAIKEGKPLHMVLTNVCPRTGIRCERTYFLSSNSGISEKIEQVHNDEGYVVGYRLDKSTKLDLSNENRLSTYYLKVLQLYFKLVEKLEGNLQYGSVVNFKTMLAKKLAEIDAKSNVPHGDLKIEVNFRSYDSSGNETNLNQKAEEVEEASRPKFSMTAPICNKQLLVVQVSVKNIKSNDGLSNFGEIRVGDSFMLQKNVAVNLTRNVQYFDFFNLHLQDPKSLDKVNETQLSEIMGPRVQPQHHKVQIYIPLTDKIQLFGVDNRYVYSRLGWYERGLQISSVKMGTLLLSFDDIEAYKYIANPDLNLLELKIKEPLIFRKFAKSALIIRFVGKSVSEVFYPLIKALEQVGKPFESIEDDSQLVKDTQKSIGSLRNAKLKKVLDMVHYDYEKELGLFLEEPRAVAVNPETGEPINLAQKLELFLFVGYLSEKTAVIDSIRHHCNGNNEIAFTDLQADDFGDKSTDQQVFLSNTVLKLSKLSIASRRNIVCINVPHYIDYKRLLKDLNEEGYLVHRVVSCVNASLIVNHCFSGHTVEPYLDGSLVDTCIINTKELEQSDFDYVYKLQNSTKIANVIQAKEDRLDAGATKALIGKSTRKRLPQNLSPISKSNLYYVDWRIPFSRSFLEGAIRSIFSRQDSIILRNLGAKAKIESNKNDIHSELLALQERAKYLKQYYAGEGVLVYSLYGIVRFEDDPSRVFQLKAAKGIFELKELATGLSFADEEYKGERVSKVQYGDKQLLGHFGLFVDFSGQANVESLKALLLKNLIEVN